MKTALITALQYLAIVLPPALAYLSFCWLRDVNGKNLQFKSYDHMKAYIGHDTAETLRRISFEEQAASIAQSSELTY